jgi:hypothetical protein
MIFTERCMSSGGTLFKEAEWAMRDWMKETQVEMREVSKRVKLRVPPGRFEGRVGRREKERVG